MSPQCLRPTTSTDTGEDVSFLEEGTRNVIPTEIKETNILACSKLPNQLYPGLGKERKGLHRNPRPLAATDPGRSSSIIIVAPAD